MAQKQQRKCPICGKPADQRSKHFPFCRERCRTIDLGNWASETYVAHSPVTEVDELFEAIRKESSDE